MLTWILKAMGFWWFKSKENSFAKGRELLFWGGSLRDDTPSKFHVTVEWTTGKRARHCGLTLEFAGEVASSGYPYKVFIGIPRLFNLWVGTDGIKPLWNKNDKRWWNSHEIGFRLHHNSLWLSFFSNPMGHDWDFKHKSWKRERSINFEDLVFGRYRCKQEDLTEPTPIRVPMPEGNYSAVIWHKRLTWTWARFRKPKVKEYTEIELEKPPLFAGKGDNGWDMDDNGIYGTSLQGLLSADEAAGQYRDMVLKERKKYGEPQSYAPQG